MELKLTKIFKDDTNNPLLIVPYGIETPKELLRLYK